MKVIKLICILYLMPSFCILNAYAADIVRLYKSIATLNADSNITQGSFIDGLDFNVAINMNFSGLSTYYINQSTGCVFNHEYAWTRYFIIPEKIQDSTKKLTLRLTSSNEGIYFGTKDGVRYYGYNIGELTGFPPVECKVGGPYTERINYSDGVVLLNYQASLEKKAGETVDAKRYSFLLPLRIAYAVNGSNTSWYQTAVNFYAIKDANISIDITNYCNIGQTKYQFDFGTMTEGAVNEPGFSKESNTQNLDINCIEPAKIDLSVITANSENGDPNKVKMGEDLVADLYLDNALQSNILFDGVNNINIPIHARLRKNINSKKTIEAGEYTGTSVLKLSFQ
ncbi:hypothetical protein [Providencia sp. Me31A]|uniref:hypothetical protein n=1 Tax=Providencia sp. Me31A TaxID=3392637 RepID=UPI003D2A6E02